MATLIRKSGVRHIILLTLGWEELPKSVSVYGAPAERAHARTRSGRAAPDRWGLGAARHGIQHRARA